MDDEVVVDIYSESASLSFAKSAARVPIFEYTIVCDVDIAEAIPAGKKKGQKAQVKITRQ